MKLVLFLFLSATTSSLADFEDLTPGNVDLEERRRSNFFDEAVQLLDTHTVERLEKQLLMKESILKEKEGNIEMLKVELESKQQENENSWKLVSYMMKVISSSKEMYKSKEELLETQAVKIEEMAKQVVDLSQMLNSSQLALEAQERTIEELKKLVTEDSKLTDTYRQLKEGNLLQTNCDVPPFLTLMMDSLNSQQEEISELKTVLQEEESGKILLSNITREMSTLNEVKQAADENHEVALGRCQMLLQKQSSGLDLLRTLASYAVSRNNSLRYEEGYTGQLHSAELCQCIPNPPLNQTVSVALVRNNDAISTQWSSWQYDKCEGIHLPNGTKLECGEGMRERRRLKDINANKWEEEVEEEPCPVCPQFWFKKDDNGEIISAELAQCNRETGETADVATCDSCLPRSDPANQLLPVKVNYQCQVDTNRWQCEKEGKFHLIPILSGASGFPVRVGFVAQGSFPPAQTALSGKRKKLVLRNARS